MLYQVLVKYCAVFQALTLRQCALMDHYHNAISGVGKILHCISSFKVAHNTLQHLWL